MKDRIFDNVALGLKMFGVMTTLRYFANVLKINFIRCFRRFSRQTGARTVVVYLQYTAQHQTLGLRYLRFIATCLGLNCDNILIVDNSLARIYKEKIADDTECIGGDNSCYDFTGLDRGIEWIKRNYPLRDTDIVILCNDSFFRNYGHRYLKKFIKCDIKRRISQNQVIGHTDSFPDNIHIFGMQSRSWIRSNFYLMNLGTLNRLLPLTIEMPDTELFSNDCTDFFSKDIPISDNYKSYLRSWLFGEEGPDYNLKWHAHAKVDSSNFNHFKKKAKCIFSEHYLSARILHNDMHIFSVNKEKVLSEKQMT